MFETFRHAFEASDAPAYVLHYMRASVIPDDSAMYIVAARVLIKREHDGEDEGKEVMCSILILKCQPLAA